MKKTFYSIAIVVLGLTSCGPEHETKTHVADFEDLPMPEVGYWNGSDLSGELRQEESWGSVINNYYGGFTSGVVTFENVYTTDWASFKGAAYSSMTDTVTEGYLNQYSVMAGQGALGSKQFALLFDDGASFRVNYEPGYDVQTLKSVMVCNGTYPYMEMREGGYCEKFTEGDFFKVTFKGYKGELSSGEVEYYLADFREGRRFLNNNWEYLDLTPLGDAERVEVVFDGSDKGEYGLNTPRYVFIDNLVVEQQR